MKDDTIAQLSDQVTLTAASHEIIDYPLWLLGLAHRKPQGANLWLPDYRMDRLVCLVADCSLTAKTVCKIILI